MIDEVDGKILRALQCAPRASFRLIGEVAGVSEQTAARRFHALRRSGVMRVVGLVDPAVHGDARWVARIRCRPDRVGPLADALARRPDIAYAGLASGGSEIICVISAPVHVTRDDVLLRQLPQSASVLDVSIDLLIHPFGTSGPSDWTGYGGHLTPEQIRQLVGDRPDFPIGPPVRLTDEDTPLLDALAEDGRATHTQLADVTGWSTARVARRLDALEHSGRSTTTSNYSPRASVSRSTPPCGCASPRPASNASERNSRTTTRSPSPPPSAATPMSWSSSSAATRSTCTGT